MLHYIAAFLLSDGRQNDVVFEMMNNEGTLPRLVDLIQSRKDDELDLHKTLLELMYEMSRIQRLRIEHLGLSGSCSCSIRLLTSNSTVSIDDDFIMYMFDIVESLANDVRDPYLSPIIRVLVGQF